MPPPSRDPAIDSVPEWQGVTFMWMEENKRHVWTTYNIHRPNSWDDQAQWDGALDPLVANARQRTTTWGVHSMLVAGD